MLSAVAQVLLTVILVLGQEPDGLMSQLEPVIFTAFTSKMPELPG